MADVSRKSPTEQFGCIPYGLVASGRLAELTQAETVVLIILCGHCGPEFACRPAVARMASLAGITERSVTRALAGLRAKGFVRVALGGGRGLASEYKIVALDARRAPNSQAGETAKTPTARSGYKPARPVETPTVDASNPDGRRHETPTVDARNPDRPVAPTESEQRGRTQKKNRAEGAAPECALRSSAAGAAVGRNGGGARAEIMLLMGDRGADESLRGFVSKDADVKIIRRIAEAYDRNTLPIKNAGGWWRDQLRRAGVPGV